MTNPTQNGQDLGIPADLSIPPTLDRTTGLTREQIDAQRDKAIKGSAKLRPRKISPKAPEPRPDNLTERDKAVIKQLKREGADKVSTIRQHGAKLKSELAPKPAPKKAKAPHPADAHRVAGADHIANAKIFEVSLVHGGTTMKLTAKTRDEAIALADQMLAETKSNRNPLIHAIQPDGSAAMTAYSRPDSPSRKAIPAPAPAKGATTPKKATKAAAPAPRPTSKPAKPAKAADGNGKSKTEIAFALLTRKSGATRAQIIEATDWPSINLKAIAKRRKLKLVKEGDVLRFV